MNINFSKKKLAKVCNSRSKLRGEFGPRMAALIEKRLLDLDAADTLEEMRNLPGRCHELRGDYAGHFALDLVHPARLIFRPNHEPVPAKDGAIIWSEVTEILVVEVKEDYHA